MRCDWACVVILHTKQQSKLYLLLPHSARDLPVFLLEPQVFIFDICKLAQQGRPRLQVPALQPPRTPTLRVLLLRTRQLPPTPPQRQAPRAAMQPQRLMPSCLAALLLCQAQPRLRGQPR